jgi:hypothetical protein
MAERVGFGLNSIVEPSHVVHSNYRGNMVWWLLRWLDFS